MGHWSRVRIAFAMLAVASFPGRAATAAGFAAPHGAPMMGMPARAPGLVRPGARPISGPGTVPNPGQLPMQPFAGNRPLGADGGMHRWHHRWDGGDGIGGSFDEGPDFTTYGGDVRPDEGPVGYGAPDLPPPNVIPGLGPCLPPRVIKVGRGLAHPPAVRVVYGTPACAPPP